MKPAPDLFTVPTTADQVLKLADLLDDKANVESAKALLAEREGTDATTAHRRAKNARFYAAACRTLIEENKGLLRRVDVRTKRGQFLAPIMQDIRAYAVEIKLPETEATKFFNHFSSNGWKVGGKAPMLDWKAALRNWRMTWAEKNPQSQPKPIVGDPSGWSAHLREREISYIPFQSAPHCIREQFQKTR